MTKTFMFIVKVFGVYLLAQYTQGMSKPCVMRDFGNDSKVCVCTKNYCDTIERVGTLGPEEFVVFISSREGLRFQKNTRKLIKSNPKLQLITGQKNSKNSCAGKRVVEMTINTSIKYQKIMGFGGAFTDAAGININSLPPSAQELLMRSYFSEDGIEYNLGRVPIGGSDFSTHPYSYDDGGADPLLKKFSLTKEDSLHKIPLIKQAIQMSKKKLEFVGASWSSPLWMKTNNDWGGKSALKDEYYGTFAKYLLRFLDEYKKEGIEFLVLSTGNEPMNGVFPIYTFNSLGWTSAAMAKWIVNDLGPELRRSIHNKTLLITYDDQRLYLPWWINNMVKADKDVLKYLDGFGVHWYMSLDTLFGDRVMLDLHNKYKNQFVLYTEACEGYKPWQRKVKLGSWNRAETYIEDIIRNTNAWVVGWIDWNLALDQEGGPNWAKNLVDSPIIVNSLEEEFYKQPTFYAMGHVSKFIEKDASRVKVTTSKTKDFYSTAVQNPDGRIVVVLLNKSCKATTIWAEVDKRGWIKLDMPPRSIATVIC